MREAKHKKHELKRVRAANKTRITQQRKDRRNDNKIIREEHGLHFLIRDDIVYTYIPDLRRANEQYSAT